MVVKPAKTLGIIVGLVIILTIVSVDVFLVLSLLDQTVSLSMFFTGLLLAVSLPLLLVSLYWYWGLLSLSYRIDRDQLVIDVGLARHVIPLGAVLRVIPGIEVEPSSPFKGVGWPGYMSGRVSLSTGETLTIHSTEPPQEQLVVVTTDGAYGISPRNPQRFLRLFHELRELEPTRAITQRVEYTPLRALPLWRDRWFWAALGVALVANIVLYGVISGVYPGLPDRIGLHFDARGDVDLVAAKAGLLVIPTIGALALSVNGFLGALLHRREQIAAYLLSGASILLQAILWFAAMGILDR